MKAKKILSNGLKFLLLAVVAAFLALHSINLFRFVFPADQQYLAVLGFGLTGFGAIAYLIMFLWDGSTVLQRSVSLAMAVVCSIGEVAAAIFGMMIESWTKAGFTLTENDFQTMLLVIGLLSIAHFLALIVYFAGDKIGELFRDDDGDGVRNYRDPDYKPKQNKGSSNSQGKQYPVWNLNDFLAELNIDHTTAKMNVGANPDEFYRNLGRYGIGEMEISRKNVKRLYYELVNPQTAARSNGNRP